MEQNYKITGKFLVYNKLGNLINTSLFIKKIFKAESIPNARIKAINFAKKRAYRKHGKNSIIELDSNLKIVQHKGKTSEEKKKRIKKIKGKQLSLF